jgi:hypothetical protein
LKPIKSKHRSLIDKDPNLFQFEFKGTLNRPEVESYSLRLLTRTALLVLRLTIAALLIFSFVRVTPPPTSQTARARQIASYPNHTRTAINDVGARDAKLTRPSILRLVDALVSVVPKPIALLISRQNLFVQIWPEHWGAFFRRIPPSAFDPAH